MQIFIPIFLRVTDESIFLSEDLGVKEHERSIRLRQGLILLAGRIDLI